MPVPLTYPGVYIEEVPSGVRTIVGVSTSVTAFIGYTPKGPVNKAIKIFNFGDFEREFGELKKESELGYAAQQFFSNGGSEAWIVRVAKGAVKASVILKGENKNLLTVEAKSEGAWGNLLKLDVDYSTTNPDSTFNLTIYEFKQQGKEVVQGRTETYKNLSMDRNSPRYVESVVNASSRLIDISRHADLDDNVLKGLSPGWSLSGNLSKLSFPLDKNKRFISIIIDGDGPYEVAIFPQNNPPKDLDDLASSIENAVKNANPAKFAKFKVNRADVLGFVDNKGNYLRFLSGTPTNDLALERSSVHIYNASSNSASQVFNLGLSSGGREKDAVADIRPIQTGTTSIDLSDKDKTKINLGKDLKLNLYIGANKEYTITFSLAGLKFNTLNDLVNLLQDKIKDEIAKNSAYSAFSSVVFQLIGNRLRITSGLDRENVLIWPDPGLADDLGINSSPSTKINIQRYVLGIGESHGYQVQGAAGYDGDLPVAMDIQGNLLKKTGIYALEDADIFNLLCIPFVSSLEETSALAVISDAVEYCAKRRAFMILDPPSYVNTPADIKDWMGKLPVSSYAALYYPSVKIPDLQDENRLKPFPPSGTIAGLFARTDSARGVWKAPAGIDAALSNVQAMSYNLTDMENGDLNKLGINCLRSLPGYGRVSWGARTLKGSDLRADEWKYVPVRRLALYIEESLFRGLKWVVFEPNDEPLWAQIRLNVGAFMHSLFRQGAFQGTTPREAYFVKCDKESTTQDDINHGIVNIVVGFAPLKPAEFVVIKIQQMAGQIQT